jgi:hypothetical protein
MSNESMEKNQRQLNSEKSQNFLFKITQQDNVEKKIIVMINRGRLCVLVLLLAFSFYRI